MSETMKIVVLLTAVIIAGLASVIVFAGLFKLGSIAILPGVVLSVTTYIIVRTRLFGPLGRFKR